MSVKYKFKKFEFHAFQNFIWDLINRFQIGKIKFTPHQGDNLFSDHQLTHIGPVYNLDNTGDFLYVWSRNEKIVRGVTYEQFHLKGAPKIKVTFDLNAKTMTIESAEKIDVKSIEESFKKFFEIDLEDKNKIEISNILPIEMVSVFLNNTPVHATDIAEKYYKGLKIKTSGIIQGVNVYGKDVIISFMDKDNIFIASIFTTPVSADVARLQKGMPVSVIGEVCEVGSDLIGLNNCSIINDKENMKNIRESTISIIGNNNVVNSKSSIGKQKIKSTKNIDSGSRDFWIDSSVKIIGGIIVAIVSTYFIYKFGWK